MTLKDDTTKARFIPSGKRVVMENKEWRSCYAIPATDQLSLPCSLQSVAEHTLAAGTTLTLDPPASGTLVLVPTAGSISYHCNTAAGCTIEAGALLVVPQQSGATYTLCNNANTNLANVLALHLSGKTHHTGVYAFDLNSNYNKCIRPLANALLTNLNLQLGMYAGRTEDTVHLPDDKCLFVYIIEGAFEVQYRLLERGDSLLLWNNNSIAFEALSEDAIILLLVV